MEDRLDTLVPRLKAAAAEQKRHREAVAENQRRDQERRRALEHQRAMASHTFQMARHWRAARDLREFLEAVEQTVPASERDTAFSEWFDYMTRYADALDPLLTIERAKKLLPTPDQSSWFSDEQIGASLHVPRRYY